MRRLACALILAGAADAAAAEPPEVFCTACRDVYESPEDFGNFAFNLVFGDNPVLDLSQGDMIKVWNEAGQWAIVDLNFVLSSGGLSIDLVLVSFTFTYPTGTIQIRVQDPRGQITDYQVFASSTDLLVGELLVGEDVSEPEPDDSEAEPEPEIPTELDFNLGGVGSLDPYTGLSWYAGHESTFYWYMEYPETWRNLE